MVSWLWRIVRVGLVYLDTVSLIFDVGWKFIIEGHVLLLIMLASDEPDRSVIVLFIGKFVPFWWMNVRISFRCLSHFDAFNVTWSTVRLLILIVSVYVFDSKLLLLWGKILVIDSSLFAVYCESSLDLVRVIVLVVELPWFLLKFDLLFFIRGSFLLWNLLLWNYVLLDLLNFIILLLFDDFRLFWFEVSLPVFVFWLFLRLNNLFHGNFWTIRLCPLPTIYRRFIIFSFDKFN